MNEKEYGLESRVVDVKIGDYEREQVLAPAHWSDRAVQIAARTYFAPGEDDVDEMIGRVVDAIGLDEASAKELRGFLLEQKVAFNTPVWMNLGVADRSPQAWACLILGVEDDMESIQNGWLVESNTFRHGSGSGVNVSKIRAQGEPLSDGAGVGSGPISLWMRPTDAIAGVVRSGGRTRRAAKMVVLDVDHPEIREFIDLKVHSERMSDLLLEDGFDIGMNGSDSANIPFQNANHSVRVTDLFMTRLRDNEQWELVERVSGKVSDTVSAKELWESIAKAAWECGDPGLQFHDTVNDSNPVINDGEIVASNPCSEYMFLDNTVCNLASINLSKFLIKDRHYSSNMLTPPIDWKSLGETVRVTIRAMDNLVDVSSYPNELIESTTKRYRNLGLGVTDLGAVLMSLGVPYDSDEGRDLAAQIMAFVHLTAMSESQERAMFYGAYPAYGSNYKSQSKVIRQHLSAVKGHWYWGSADPISRIDPSLPLRNAQVTVIAPTGTISLLMDCETTGVEPVLAINAKKTLSGKGELDVGVDRCVKAGIESLRRKGQTGTDAEIIAANPKVFETALGDNVVSPEGHVLMMAALQPFVSGAISKTVNLPASATVEDVKRIYQLAYDNKLKAIAIYRDGSKSYQPVEEVKDEVEPTESEQVQPKRRRPSGTRAGVTHKFAIGEQEFYITVNEYEDGTPCEVFLRNNKHGSAVGGWMDVASIATSLGLQHGIPLSKFAEHFGRMNFAPQGPVISDSDIKFADSPADYVFRWLRARYGEAVRKANVTVSNTLEPTYTPVDSSDVAPMQSEAVSGGQTCGDCGSPYLRWAGTCMLCNDCGSTSGCS